MLQAIYQSNVLNCLTCGMWFSMLYTMLLLTALTFSENWADPQYAFSMTMVSGHSVLPTSASVILCCISYTATHNIFYISMCGKCWQINACLTKFGYSCAIAANVLLVYLNNRFTHVQQSTEACVLRCRTCSMECFPSTWLGWQLDTKAACEAPTTQGPT